MRGCPGTLPIDDNGYSIPEERVVAPGDETNRRGRRRRVPGTGDRHRRVMPADT